MATPPANLAMFRTNPLLLRVSGVANSPHNVNSMSGAFKITVTEIRAFLSIHESPLAIPISLAERAYTCLYQILRS